MSSISPSSPSSASSVSAAELGDALVRAWNAHDASAVASLFAAEVEAFDVADAAVRRTPEEIQRASARYLAAFPDLEIRLDELLADDGRVALVWTAHGTHAGSIMRIPPTGRVVEVRGVCILTVERGKIRQAINVWDVAGLLRALGLLPDLIGAEASES